MMSSGAAIVQWGRCPQFVCGVLAASIFLAANLPGLTQAQETAKSLNAQLFFLQAAPAAQQVSVPPSPLQSGAAVSRKDPLNSAYPIPWDSIWAHQHQASQAGQTVTKRYLSAALLSPDGQTKVHSEIQLHLNPEMTDSYISSQLVISDPRGTVLQSIPSTFHLGDGPVKETAARQDGTLSILMPAAWSKDGQQLLARQFEAVFGSDVSSDYALVWNRRNQQARIVAPTPLSYDTAVLLGWSHSNPDQILFETSTLGESKTTTLAVSHDGTTIASPSDRPLPIGQRVTFPTPSQARR
ncbi:hypothetical protein [Altericista sp. CCNU0014]|uniref:hypothetical protein n=1 Tax=Altericista sp. CCNU0014 TaxID=3082949 RepID=UPI00384EFB37